MIDEAKRGPRTLCAEAVSRVLNENASEYKLPKRACNDMDLARKISSAVLDVALAHIHVRMDWK